MSEQKKRNLYRLNVLGQEPGLDTVGNEFPEPLVLPSGSFNRRDFLRAAGFAFLGTAIAGCSRAPTEFALSPLGPTAGQIPGRSLDYATTCGACPAGCGLLVRVRDGRPIKIEGNSDHPLSRGGVCAIGQASLLGLYDRLRLQEPLKDGQPSDWNVVDNEIRQRLAEVRQRGGTVRILSGTIPSPTTRAKIEEFLGHCGNGRHVMYDPLSCSAIRDAHQQTHGQRLLPHYRFDQAMVVVGVEADFLGTWISPVEFTAGYSAGRKPTGTPPRMSYHVQFESRLSLTGSKADHRYGILPGEVGLLLTHLAKRVADRANRSFNTAGIESPPVPAGVLDQLAERLWQQRGHTLIVCGTQEIAHQVLCNFINDMLGSYSATIDISRPSLQSQGDDGSLEQLLQDLRDRRVDALFIVDCNPVYDLPNGEELRGLLGQVPLLVACAERPDETTTTANYVCPLPNSLASWGDAEPVRGCVALSQPAILPLEQSRPLLESLDRWMGLPQRSSLEIIQDYWRNSIYPHRTSLNSFQEFWDTTLHDGQAAIDFPEAEVPAFNSGAVQPVLRATRPGVGEFTLVLYPKVSLREGRHAYNPWLQELPDPITKVTWDNYACLSPVTAEALHVQNGSMIRLEVSGEQEATSLELPALVQPGQPDQVVAVALGYGGVTTSRFTDVGPPWLEARPTLGDNGRIGKSAAPLVNWQNGKRTLTGRLVRLTRLGRLHHLACTQQYHSIQVPPSLAPPGHETRPAIQETTLVALAHPEEHAQGHHHPEVDLWPPDHPTPGHRWGMVIDLQACTGCSSCVVACQVENNIPVVGKDEVRRQREMHWLRIDRYYSEHGGKVDVAFQPMMCQHCGNAPCETVCPVLATVHSSEGLNQQVYNRCVGTRYCANNCPYKVRRFNWFDYAHEDTLQNLTLNPDVTVRSRGVMEKCTFCVQRIQEAKIEARARGERLEDGDIKTACQQSCPANAIHFGDLNDPNSQVSRLLHDPRRYRVLAELNVQPSVNYLEIVRNRQEE